MTLSQEAREQLIVSTLAAGSEDKRPITWRGREEMWPVVRIKASSLLLNPNSHRIRAQTRALPPAKADAFQQDPLGTDAQATINELIRATPGYPRVRDTLVRDLQQDPGLVTHKGVLINANTRAVAIREANIQDGYIKVQVLPSDATKSELTALELRYQMQQEVRQDYSFTNQLLLIEELMSQKWLPEVIGLEIYRSLNPKKEADRKEAAKRVTDEARLLAIIDLVIAASGGVMNYPQFDDWRQTLIEIDQAVESLKRKNQDALAIRIRDARITVMLSGLGYEAVRQVDAKFLDDYVPLALHEEDALEPVAAALLTSETTSEDGGLDGLDFLTPTAADPDAAGPVSLQRVYDALVKTPKDGDVTFEADDGALVTMSRDAFKAAVNSVFIRATRAKALDTDKSDAMTAPMKHLASAASLVDRARKALGELPRRDQFDKAYLQRELRKLARSCDELTVFLSDKKFDVDFKVDGSLTQDEHQHMLDLTGQSDTTEP